MVYGVGLDSHRKTLPGGERSGSLIGSPSFLLC